jgi:BirA family biotin operon repressor/biotin-[acetyl-CoA-carboxylase] ligase
MSTRINVDKLQMDLHTKRFGRRIIFLREVGSTIEVAKQLADYGAEEGTVVIAEVQTAGRGRMGRRWISPEGGLYFSIILRPKISPKEAVRLVFLSGLAVAQVLRGVYSLKAEIKWPNDVLVNGQKVCGVLAEMNTTGEKVNYVIASIGLNANFDVEKVFPEEFRKVATTLENELGRKVELEELFKVLLGKLESFYELFLKEGFDRILAEWKKYAGFLGCQVEVASGAEKWVGLASDVGNDGALILRLEDGTVKRVFVGDATLRSR